MELEQRAAAQCSVLRDRYQPCLPGGAHLLRFDVSFSSIALGLATAELSLPFGDTEVAVTAHFESDSRLPDLTWGLASLPPAFYPQIDFQEVAKAVKQDQDSELLAVVSSFLAALARFHEAQIPKASFLWRCWRALADHEAFRGRAHSELLVSCPEPPDGPDAVTLAFSVPLDCPGGLPAALTADNVSDAPAACLLFKTARVNGSATSAEAVERAAPRLFLSASLRAFLQAAGFELRLPLHAAQGDSRRLLDLALFVREALQGVLAQAGNSCDARRRVLALLVQKLRGAVLEFDAELFRAAAFLLEWQDFFFVLRIELQEVFPHNRYGPLIALRSIYHTVTGEDGVRQPFERSFRTDVPHSPRWEAAEFVERWLRFVREALPKFQADSVRGNTI